MSVLGVFRSYWRIILFVLIVSAALFALFVPGGIFADGQTAFEENDSVDDSPINLQYGLGLDGGTRISAPVIGMTAEDVSVDPDDQVAVTETLYDELGLDTGDVMVRLGDGSGSATVEVFSDGVNETAFRDALRTAGVDVSLEDIRDGVTDQTREDMMLTIETKINEAGLSGGRVTERATLDGEHYIVTEVPDMTPAELRQLLEERGVVEVVAHYPNQTGGQVNETVLVRDDFDTIGSAEYDSSAGHHVPVTITPDRAPEYQQRMNELGFTQGEGLENCDVSLPGSDEFDFDRGQPNYCLLTVVDGEVVDAHSMSADLGGSMASGEWQAAPNFVMLTPSQQDAASLSVSLRAGALQAPLDFENDQTYSISPALADRFKVYSLFIGILSVLTVSGVVYLRYTDHRVALPMIVTALAEVVVLLGFAAAIRMPLDLSHIAGFIAVVGTGVDDLIIIADEVMSEGDVNSRRVYESRFRKAFWVIGAAAATTIIALSPLAVLSLGDLRGFAIIAILGVLVGVLVTRPAYGDILRYLMTKTRE